MLHLCPQCNRHYDCQPEFHELLAGLLAEKPDRILHALQCGTPFEWRCPECAKRAAMLLGEKNLAVISFIYTQPAA
jgi:hypothetical protein